MVAEAVQLDDSRVMLDRAYALDRGALSLSHLMSVVPLRLLETRRLAGGSCQQCCTNKRMRNSWVQNSGAPWEGAGKGGRRAVC